MRIASSIVFLFRAIFRDRSLGTTPISGKTLSEWKGHCRSSGEVPGILRAALGVQKILLGMRNPILGMASHDLCNAKTTILGAVLGAIPGIAANPPERSSFAPAFVFSRP